jgi:unsaturated rhamnogalacturonyl hydrolase
MIGSMVDNSFRAGAGVRFGLSLWLLGAAGCGTSMPDQDSLAGASGVSGSTAQGVGGWSGAGGGMSGDPQAARTAGASSAGSSATGGASTAMGGGSGAPTNQAGAGGTSATCQAANATQAGAGGTSATCQAANATRWTEDFADLIVDTDIAATYQAKGFEYTPGIVVLAVTKAYEKTKHERYKSYVQKWVDGFFNDSDSLDLGERELDRTLDVIQPSVNVLAVYEWTKDDKYKTALTKLRARFADLKIGSQGGFEHKPERPQEMWADGTFMAYPFLTAYGRVVNDSSAFDLAAQQVMLFAQNATDPTTGLVFHAWDQDCNGSGSGADRWTPLPDICTSPVVWSRGMGWYMAAIVEVLGNLPPSHPQRSGLLDALRTSAAGLEQSQFSSGLWFQVMDRASDAANWLETSGSGLFVYALKKAVDQGYLDDRYCAVAQKGWQALQTKLSEGPRVQDAVEAMGVLPTASAYESKARVSNSAHALLAIVLAASVFE